MNIDVNTVPSAMAIQCLPMGSYSKEETYRIVDSVIAIIQDSGLSYYVGPFETVVEGPLSRLLELLRHVHCAMIEQGVPTAASYIKLWSGKNIGTTDEKIQKYH